MLLIATLVSSLNPIRNGEMNNQIPTSIWNVIQYIKLFIAILLPLYRKFNHQYPTGQVNKRLAEERSVIRPVGF